MLSAMSAIPRTSPGGPQPGAPVPSDPKYFNATIVDEALAKRINGVFETGKEIAIVAPRCRTMGGRAELRDALRDAGVHAAAMAAFGWVTVNPTEHPGRGPRGGTLPQPPPPPAVEAEPALAAEDA